MVGLQACDCPDRHLYPTYPIIRYRCAMTQGSHIIGSAPNFGNSSTNAKPSPSRNRTPKAQTILRSGGSRSSDKSTKEAPVKSMGSLATSPNSRVKVRPLSDTSNTRTGCSFPIKTGHLSHSHVLNLCQFLSILNPSRDDIMFAGWMRDYGYESAVSEVDPKGWTNFGRRLDGAAG